MLHLLLPIALAADPAARCERTVARLAAARVGSLHTTAQIEAQLAADQKRLRKAERRCAALLRQSPVRAEDALSRLARDRGRALRDARGVDPALEPLRQAAADALLQIAETHVERAFAANPDPALSKALTLRRVTLRLEREELPLPAEARTTWTSATIADRSRRALDHIEAMEYREVCLGLEASAQARALRDEPPGDAAGWIALAPVLLSLEAAYRTSESCARPCVEATERLDLLLSERPEAYMAHADALLTVREVCLPSSLGELALEAHALGVAATRFAAGAATAIPIEARSLQARAGQAAAEAHALTATALLMAKASAPERLTQVERLRATLPQLQPPSYSARDHDQMQRLWQLPCVADEDVETLAWLLYMAEPLAAEGLLSTEGAPLLDQFAALGRAPACAALAPCTAALDRQREQTLTLDADLPRAEFDAEIMKALSAKTRLLRTTETTCTEVSAEAETLRAESFATLALAYEDMADALGSSTVPRFLDAGSAELYQLELERRAAAVHERAGLARAAAAELDPQRFSRGREVALARTLAEQEAQRQLLVGRLSRPQSVPALTGTSTPQPVRVRDLLRQELDALEALVRENEGCLGALTLESVQLTVEQGRMSLLDPDLALLQDMRSFVQFSRAEVEAEIQACEAAR